MCLPVVGKKRAQRGALDPCRFLPVLKYLKALAGGRAALVPFLYERKEAYEASRAKELFADGVITNWLREFNSTQGNPLYAIEIVKLYAERESQGYFSSDR